MGRLGKPAAQPASREQGGPSTTSAIAPAAFVRHSRMSFELFWEPGGVVRRHVGHVSIAERRRSLELICNDPRFDELRYSITDYLGVLSFEHTPEATAETAALHIAPARTNPNIAIATVAVNPDAIAAVHQFIALRYIDLPYQLFSTMEAARAWVASLRPMHAPRPRQLNSD